MFMHVLCIFFCMFCALKSCVPEMYAALQEDPEAPLDREDDPEEGSWPSKGAIVVENVKMRYRADTPLVLHGVNFTVRPPSLPFLPLTVSGRCSCQVGMI